MSAILGAIGRGFTSNQILRKLANNYPNYANAIYGAQAAGYGANQILRKFHNNKTGQNLPEDAFLTEHEKTRKQDDKRKRNRALATIGVLGTAGAVGAGLYQLANRGAAITPQVLPAIKKTQPPKQVGYNSPVAIGHIEPRQPNQPQSPITNSPSNIPKETMPTQPSDPLRDSIKNQRDPIKSVELVRNLKLEPRFDLMVKQGYDTETTAQLLKMTMPKEVFASMQKVPGGIETIVEDYKNYMSQKKPENNQIQDQQEQIIPEQMQKQEAEQKNNPVNLPSQQQLPQRQIESEKPASSFAMLPKGQIGEVQSVKNGVATVNVEGKTKKLKVSEIYPEPEGMESTVRDLISKIPENMKSTALQSTVFVNLPTGNTLMLSQFYDGKIAWYLDVPEDTYDNISLGTYTPKGESRTGIGEYNPSVSDSRGAGFHNEIKVNPKYSSENKGKTWGYAKNSYDLMHSIQSSLHKISKEKYDENGKLIEKKPRKKST